MLTSEKTIPEAEDAPLTRVWGMAEGPDGHLYVIDLHGVQVFTKAGEYLRQIGRRAGGTSPGPGEFAVIGTIGFVGDTLWMTDNAVGRITLFETDGDLIDTWPGAQRLQISEAGHPFRPLGVLAPDRIVFVEHTQSLDVSLYADAGAELVIVDPGGERVATLPRLDPTHAYMVEFEPPSTRIKRRQPFAFSDMIGVDPFSRKFVVARRPLPADEGTASYSLRGFGSDGGERYRSRRRYVPVKLSDADVDDWIDRLLSNAGPSRFLPNRVRREVLRRGIFRPGYYPPISNNLTGMFKGPLAFGRDGSVWVKRTVPEDEEVAQWDVFDGDGTFRGTAEGPSDLVLFVIAGDQAWGVRYDEFRVPRIVGYEIEPEG